VRQLARQEAVLKRGLVTALGGTELFDRRVLDRPSVRDEDAKIENG
jgi:hypothetical protein